MPRQSRIDAPGALHHVICRGIERRPIFEDDADRKDFVRRLGDILSETGTPCYAWALIPNHFHLLFRTGKMPVSTVMRRLVSDLDALSRFPFCGHGRLLGKMKCDWQAVERSWGCSTAEKGRQEN